MDNPQDPGQGGGGVVAIKVILVLVGLAMLFVGGAMASSENKSGWVTACALTGFAVFALAATERLRWTILFFFVAVAVGFTSCTANFVWHGG